MVGKKYSLIHVVLAVSFGVALLILAAFVPANAAPVNPTATDAKEALSQRVVKQKSAFPSVLTAAQQTKLKVVCKPAQTKANLVATAAKNKLELRQDRYQKISAQVKAITSQLTTSNVKTAEIEAQSQQLAQLVAAYDASQQTYQQALQDLKDVDCVVDPQGFNSLLLAARNARQKAVTDSQAIQAYIRTTIKPSLQAIKTELSTITNGVNQ